MQTFQEELIELKACGFARQWVGERTREQAIAECSRLDWMLWYASRLGPKLGVAILYEWLKLLMPKMENPIVLKAVFVLEGTWCACELLELSELLMSEECELSMKNRSTWGAVLATAYTLNAAVYAEYGDMVSADGYLLGVFVPLRCTTEWSALQDRIFDITRAKLMEALDKRVQVVEGHLEGEEQK